jgi:hypothetical protein
MSKACDNLIPFPYTDTTKTENGLTWTVNSDGSIKVDGVPTESSSFTVYDGPVISSKTLTVSVSGSYTNTEVVILLSDDDSINVMWSVIKSFESFDMTKYPTATSMRIFARRVVDNAKCSGTIYPMLNKGESALPYQPYFTGLRDSKVTAVESMGVNICPPLIKGIGINPSSGIAQVDETSSATDLDYYDCWRNPTGSKVLAGSEIEYDIK